MSLKSFVDRNYLYLIVGSMVPILVQGWLWKEVEIGGYSLTSEGAVKVWMGMVFTSFPIMYMRSGFLEIREATFGKLLKVLYGIWVVGFGLFLAYWALRLWIDMFG